MPSDGFDLHRSLVSWCFAAIVAVRFSQACEGRASGRGRRRAAFIESDPDKLPKASLAARRHCPSSNA
jgi:hypothetical protein